MAADWAEAQLRELAGTFSRRATAYRAKHHVPLIEARAGERKHELAEPQVPQDPPSRGLFPVITGNAPAPVWEVKHNAAGQITEARHRPKWPSVKHSDFHRLDPHWGQVTIRRCGDPPFGAPGIRTGHEWVERQAQRQPLAAAKTGNCFGAGSDFAEVNRRAAYDPAKLRGKQLVHRKAHAHSCVSDPSGVRTMRACLPLRAPVIKPLLAGTARRRGRPPKVVPPLDQHHLNRRTAMGRPFATLGLAA